MIKDVHDSPIKGSHSEVATTYTKLANAYYWPNFTDIKNYVKSGHASQIAEKSKIRYRKITPHFEKDNRLHYKINLW